MEKEERRRDPTVIGQLERVPCAGKGKGKEAKTRREEGEEAIRTATGGMENEVRVLGLAVPENPRYTS